MRTVADQLTEWALKEKDPKRVDKFGRTAFNRYYYSLFLENFELVTTLNNSWKTVSHKDLPSLLIGKVFKKIKDKAIKLNKEKLINDKELEDYTHRAQSALSELSNILNESRAIRVIADYNPDIVAIRTKNIIKLSDQSTKNAKRWISHTSHNKGIVLRICSDLAIIKPQRDIEVF